MTTSPTGDTDTKKQQGPNTGECAIHSAFINAEPIQIHTNRITVITQMLSAITSQKRIGR